MEKPWLRSYPPGVPAQIELEQATTICDMFEAACREFSKQPAYISLGKTLSYHDIDRLSLQFAHYLLAEGLRKGDRVALMMPNVLQYPIALFGVLRAGGVVVNCNPLCTPRELAQQLNDSGALFVVVLENFAHTLAHVVQRTSIAHVVVTPLGEMLGPVKSVVVNLVVRYVKKLVPPWSIPGALTLAKALAIGRQHPGHPPSIAPNDMAFLQYTGGTTGIPKAAILSHRNICANVLQAEQWVRPYVQRGQERVITALPLNHIFALTANCLLFMRIGGCNLLIANARDIPDFIGQWKKFPATAITGVNTLFNALLKHPDFSSIDFSSLHLTLGGGMAVQKVVALQWRKVTGCPLTQAYGLTEASPAVTINPFVEAPFVESIGLPIPSTEISIRDDHGHEVGAADVGEICIRGPQVTSGYWKQPSETAQMFTADGFLKTGDMGYMDENGYVFLVDRKTDMILVSGFNVYPNEIEEVLAMHPAIREAAAIGVPHEETGEAVKVFVSSLDPTLSQEAVLAHCREHLSRYKCPRHVEFRSDLPKTPVGKILRRALREK